MDNSNNSSNSIINQIKNNEIKLLYLREAPDEYFGNDYKMEEFVDALSKNTSIYTIRLKQDFLGCLFGSNRLAVVSAIGKLKNVQSIELGNAGVQVPALITMINDAKKLKFLTLETIVLQGLPHEFNSLESTLRLKTTLKRFTIRGCYPSFEEIDLNRLVEVGNHHDDREVKEGKENKGGGSDLLVPAGGNDNNKAGGADFNKEGEDNTETTADLTTSMADESDTSLPLQMSNSAIAA